MAYTKTTWVNDTTPAIDATNLNHIETGIDEAHDAIENTSTGHDHDGTDSKQVDHANLLNKGTNTHAEIDTHLGSTNNPHSVTKSQVGLTNVTDDAQLKRAAADINSFTEKTTPVDADIVIIEDSAASYTKKKVQVGNLPSGTGGSEFVSGDEFMIGVIPALLYSPQTHTGDTHTSLKLVDNTTDNIFTMHRTGGTGTTTWTLPTGWTKKCRLVAILINNSDDGVQCNVELYNISSTFAVATVGTSCASDTQPNRSALFDPPISSHHLTYRHWADSTTTEMTTYAAWVEVFAVKD